MLKTVKLSEIKEYEHNNKDHPPEQVILLAKMIEEYGYDSNIIVNKENIIIAGHGRLQALKKLGRTECEVKVKDKLTKAQERKYRLLDNKISELAQENRDNIEIEIRELEDQELAELYDIDLNALEYDEDKEDSIPEPAKEAKLVELGDIFQLGSHRLMCGDSTNIQDVEKLMDGKKSDIYLSDPPYNVDYEGKTKDALKIQNDSKEDGEFLQFLTEAFKCVDESLKEGGVFYIWHADSEGFNFRTACKLSERTIRQCLIWNKNCMVMGRQDYQWKHEPCLYGWKDGAGHLWNSDRKQTTILEFNRPSASKLHPTMKPIELLEYQINNSSKIGETVLDTFGGSGSTLIASEKTNRKCYMMELDPVYIEVIIKRYHDYTKGQKEIKCINRPSLDLQPILNGK